MPCSRRTVDRHEATPQIWQEVYLSALLRAILYADDPNYVSADKSCEDGSLTILTARQRLAGYRKLDPIVTQEAELRFIAAAETAFFKGKCMSCHPRDTHD